jgi:hypothetical protein
VQRPGPNDQVPATHSERRRGLRPGHHGQGPALSLGHRPGHHDLLPATLNEQRRRQRLRRHGEVYAAHNEATAWTPLLSNCGSQRAVPRATDWHHD